jgi:hypothetical protein
MSNETHRAPPRYNISDFFSSLLELTVGKNPMPGLGLLFIEFASKLLIIVFLFLTEQNVF